MARRCSKLAIIPENDNNIIEGRSFDPDVDYCVLMLGNLRPSEALFDLGTDVVKNGHELQFKCGDFEFKVHNRLELIGLFQVINELSKDM